MLIWRTLLVAGLVTLSAGCGAAPAPTTPTPTAPATATADATATIAATATVEAIATMEATATTSTSPTPADTVAATEVPTSTSAPTGQTTAQDFAPTVRSVWNTAVGLDQMKGACAKGSMLPVYGLVQITPQGDKLGWKNQEPAPYTFSRVQANEYQYAGPTAINDGMVTMTLKFTSDKSLEMLREFVATADPGCLHTHEYTGTFQWNKP